jgi:hypothetical protein
MQTKLSFSTSQAAQYLGVKRHVLDSNFRRHGNYLGIEPRKGASGRLYWNAAQTRDAAIPPIREQPEGMALWLDIAERYCPGIDKKDAYRLGLVLLGSEATAHWKPVPGQTVGSMLKDEPTLALLIVQATLDRVDSALTAGGALDSILLTFARVLTKRLGYLAASNSVEVAS